MAHRGLRRALLVIAAVCSAVALLTAAVNESFAWLAAATVITLATYAAALADHELNRDATDHDGRQIPLDPDPLTKLDDDTP